MPLNLPTLYKRTGSAIVYAALRLTAILWKTWMFAILICAFNFLCLREYFRLMQLIDSESHRPAWIPVLFQALGLLGILPVYLFFAGGHSSDMVGWPVTLLLCAIAVLPAVILLIPVLFALSLLSA